MCVPFEAGYWDKEKEKEGRKKGWIKEGANGRREEGLESEKVGVEHCTKSCL